MLLKNLWFACLVAALTSGVALAQPKPASPSATPTTTRPPASASSTTAPAPVSSATPAGTKVNLNTATADQLDALPDVGKARTKDIIAERAKGKFKDWADFDARTMHTSVNKGVKAKIKDLVTF